MKKRILFLILIFAVILLRTSVFSFFFSYRIIRERAPVGELKDEELKSAAGKKKKEHPVEDIIQDAQEITASRLGFTFEKCDREVNALAVSQKANCIGYAAFLAAVIRYELRQQNLEDQWQVRHQVGNVYFLNTNIHRYIKSAFFRDHDFVTMENTQTGETVALDATVYDYLKINRIRLQ